MKTNKRKRNFPIGYKKNPSSDENQESKEVRAVLQSQKKLIRELRIEKSHALIDAEWKSLYNEAKVTKVSGSSLECFGHKRKGQTFLYPEEVLYLVEMNRVQLFHNNVRLSLQRSYSVLLGGIDSVTLHEFKIYKYFLVYGYKVIRCEQICRQPLLCNFDKDALDSTERDDTNVVRTQELSFDAYYPKTSICKSSRSKPDFHLVILKQEKLWTTLQRINSTVTPFLFTRNNNMNTNSLFSIQNVDILQLHELLL